MARRAPRAPHQPSRRPATDGAPERDPSRCHVVGRPRVQSVRKLWRTSRSQCDALRGLRAAQESSLLIGDRG
jgi:hypothetical protein